MKNILIIGARGYGREYYGGLKRYQKDSTGYVVKGFLDDNKNILDNYKGFAPIISSVEDYEIGENDIFVCALGDPKAREKYVNIIQNKGGTFLTTVHPSSIISDTAEIGEGVNIGQFCTISENVKIGAFTSVQAYSVLGHDVQTGKFCSLGAYTFIGGNSIIGDNSTLYTRSTILPNLILGNNVITGAGSVVIRNVRPGITVFGIPAKKIIT